MLRLDWGLRRSNQPHAHLGGDSIMKREIIRVELLSTYLERWKAPTSAVTRWGIQFTCRASHPSIRRPEKWLKGRSNARPSSFWTR
jgi:hypothetical protein